MLTALAFKLDSLGFRPLIAKTASLVYPDQSFSVDASGNWVNKQDGGTIVSPTIHTTKYAALREWVLHHWAYCYTPKPGDVLVDLGTGIGEEAVIFSPMIGASGRMYAIEAQPSTFACLQETIRRSGLQNVTAVHCAVADMDGEAEISDGPVHLANSILTGGSIKVPQRSLDSLVREWRLDRIDFLRLNIEGAEKLAIQGMTDSIHKVRNLAISCHDFCGFPSKADVLGFLNDSGFKVTTRDPEPDAPWIGDYLYARR